mgnify:FL=1
MHMCAVKRNKANGYIMLILDSFSCFNNILILLQTWATYSMTISGQYNFALFLTTLGTLCNLCAFEVCNLIQRLNWGETPLSQTFIYSINLYTV